MKWGAPSCHVPPLHVLHSVLLGSPRQSLSEAGEWAPAGSVKHPVRIPTPSTQSHLDFFLVTRDFLLDLGSCGKVTQRSVGGYWYLLRISS